jgi:hypothetical protein
MRVVRGTGRLTDEKIGERPSVQGDRDVCGKITGACFDHGEFPCFYTEFYRG